MAPKVAPKKRAPEGEGRASCTYIVFWAVGFFLMCAMGFLLGRSARPNVQHNLEHQLGSARKRFQQCKEKRERARVDFRKEPDWDKTPVGRLQAQNDVLIDDNEDLIDEQDELKEDAEKLKNTIADLQEEVARRQGLSTEEREKLNEMVKKGEISVDLAELLGDWEEMGTARKDELLSRLVDELLLRKELFQGCQTQLARGRKDLEDAKAADAKRKTVEAANLAAQKVVAAAFAAKEAEQKMAAARASTSKEVKVAAETAVHQAKTEEQNAKESQAQYQERMKFEQNLAATRAGKEALAKAKMEANAVHKQTLEAAAAQALQAAKVAKASTLQDQHMQHLQVKNQVQSEVQNKQAKPEPAKTSDVLAGLSAEQLAALVAAASKK